MAKIHELRFYCFGCVMLFAACTKLIDPQLFGQIGGSALFGLSIVSDLLLASLLFFAPRDRRLYSVVFGAFAAYLVYSLLMLSAGVPTCNCFGRDTPLAVPLIIDLLGLVFFGSSFWSSSWKQSTFIDESSRWRVALMQSLMVILVVCFASGLYQWVNADSNGLRVLESKLQLKKGRPWQEVRMKLKNNLIQTARIVGVSGNCQLSLASKLPLEIQPTETVSFSMAIASEKLLIRKEGFLRGEVTVYYEIVTLEGNRAELASDIVSWGFFN